MARNIERIADDLDAASVGPVSTTEETSDADKAATEARTLADAGGIGFLGSMREDAELLDTIVADAMRRRQLQAWCPRPDEFAALEAMAEQTGRSLNELLDEAGRRLLKQRAGHQPESGEGTGRGDV